MVLSWCHESTTRWSSSAQTWLNWRDDTEASLSAWLLNSASLHDVLPYTENITPHLTTKSNKPSTVGHLADVNTTICHKPVLYWVQINGLKLNAHKCWQWPCYNSYLWHYLTMTLPVLWHYLYCGIKAVACIAESFLNDKMTTAWRHTVLVFTATSRGATLDNNWTVATTHTDIHTSITSPQQSPCTQRLNYCIKYIHTHTHTHTHLTGLYPGLPRSAGTRKVKPIWILLKQETVSGSGISWTTCKSAPRSRQTTMPAPHHSVFTGLMAFMTPNQQHQSIEGKYCIKHTQQMQIYSLCQWCQTSSHWLVIPACHWDLVSLRCKIISTYHYEPNMA